MKLEILSFYCASVTGKTLETVTRNDVPKQTQSYWESNPDEAEITRSLLEYIDDRDMNGESTDTKHFISQPKDSQIGLIVKGKKYPLKDHEALMICVNLFRALFNKAKNTSIEVPACEIIDDFSDLTGVDFTQFLDKSPVGTPKLTKCPGCGDAACDARQSYEYLKGILPHNHPVIKLGRSLFET